MEWLNKNIRARLYATDMIMNISRWWTKGSIDLNPDSVINRIVAINDNSIEFILSSLNIRVEKSYADSLNTRSVTENIEGITEPVSVSTFTGDGFGMAFLTVDDPGNGVPPFHGKRAGVAGDLRIISS